jgi:hypothetical protein
MNWESFDFINCVTKFPYEGDHGTVAWVVEFRDFTMALAIEIVHGDELCVVAPFGRTINPRFGRAINRTMRRTVEQ